MNVCEQHHNYVRESSDTELAVPVTQGPRGWPLAELGTACPILEGGRGLMKSGEGRKTDRRRRRREERVFQTSVPHSSHKTALRRPEGVRREGGRERDS